MHIHFFFYLIARYKRNVHLDLKMYADIKGIFSKGILRFKDSRVCFFSDDIDTRSYSQKKLVFFLYFLRCRYDQNYASRKNITFLSFVRIKIN